MQATVVQIVVGHKSEVVLICSVNFRNPHQVFAGELVRSGNKLRVNYKQKRKVRRLARLENTWRLRKRGVTSIAEVAKNPPSQLALTTLANQSPYT